jgi:hypothetical protein
MKGNRPKVSPEAVKKLAVIGEKQGTISLKDLALDMGLSSEDTLIFLREAFPDGSGVEVYSQMNECMVDINASEISYDLTLTPPEWIGLSQILGQIPVSELLKNPALNSLKKKMVGNAPVKAVMELLNQLEAWDSLLSDPQQSFVPQIEEAAAKNSVIGIVTAGEKSYQVFPYKVIHLEGTLSMIAEDSSDHCLLVVPVNELRGLTFIESTSVPRVSNYEIEEFIVAIRSMGEKETRLILKIYDPQTANLFPNHHFLGKPCMVTNPNGDLIWAAYVEPCEDLFEWLISLKNNVEILDPSDFKDQYLTYCEEKLRKVS